MPPSSPSRSTVQRVPRHRQISFFGQRITLTSVRQQRRVEDEESVYLFLMQFMECQKETAGSLRQRYEQQYRCEHPVHRLELTPELFLVLDGQTLADFGGDNWRQKLEEMELVL